MVDLTSDIAIDDEPATDEAGSRIRNAATATLSVGARVLRGGVEGGKDRVAVALKVQEAWPRTTGRHKPKPGSQFY